jgi:hypothetical protein
MITGKAPCGFCETEHHDLCCSTGSGILRNALPATVTPDRMWQCPCAAAGHAHLGVTARLVRHPGTRPSAAESR